MGSKVKGFKVFGLGVCGIGTVVGVYVETLRIALGSTLPFPLKTKLGFP